MGAKPKLPRQGVAGVPPPSGQLLPIDLTSPVKKLSKSGVINAYRDACTEAKIPPVSAWYYNPNSEEDSEENDPTLPHHFNPDQHVTQEHLQSLGVLVWTGLQTSNYTKNPLFNLVKSDRGYHYEEVVTVAPGSLPDYDLKKKEFFNEHLHEHEEVRLILEGGGYEDVRDFEGRWIRIHITKGVLIELPRGMYHRFTLDDTNYLKAVLLYQENPIRIQFDRNDGTDIMEVRLRYKANILNRDTSLKLTSSDLNSMLEGLDDEVEMIRARQDMVDATLSEADLCAGSVATQKQTQCGPEVVKDCMDPYEADSMELDSVNLKHHMTVVQ